MLHKAMLAAPAPVAPIASHQLAIFLLQAGILLAAAFVLGRLAMRFKMPAIAGELCAGVLLGPSILGHISPRLLNWYLPHTSAQFHLLDVVAQVGVILLVGLSGVFMDLGMVRRRWASATKIGVAALIVPLGLGVAAGFLVPGTLLAGHASRGTFAMFLGVALGVSALPVIAKTLMDMRMLHRNVGQLILCAVTVDDTVGWLLLSFVSAMAASHLRASNVWQSLGYLALIIVGALVLRPLVRIGLCCTSRLDRAAGGATASFVVALILLSAAATQAMGMEGVFGAFVAGLVISSCRAHEPAALEPLRSTVMSFFAPLFFATAGLRIDLGGLAKPKVALAGLAILVVAIVGKVVGAYTGARLSRLNNWEALAVSAGVNARGAVEIVVAMVGLRAGILSSQMYTIIVLIAIVTSLIAPPVLRVTMTRVEQTAEEELRAARFSPNDLDDRLIPQGEL